MYDNIAAFAATPRRMISVMTLPLQRILLA